MVLFTSLPPQTPMDPWKILFLMVSALLGPKPETSGSRLDEIILEVFFNLCDSMTVSESFGVSPKKTEPCGHTAKITAPHSSMRIEEFLIPPSAALWLFWLSAFVGSPKEELFHQMDDFLVGESSSAKRASMDAMRMRTRALPP